MPSESSRRVIAQQKRAIQGKRRREEVQRQAELAKMRKLGELHELPFKRFADWLRANNVPPTGFFVKLSVIDRLRGRTGRYWSWSEGSEGPNDQYYTHWSLFVTESGYSKDKVGHEQLMMIVRHIENDTGIKWPYGW